MTQLRQDHEAFIKRNVIVMIIGPDGPRAFKRFWEEQKMPFIGLADVGSKVGDLYQQEVNILKLGRMPAVFVIDEEGKIRFVHYAQSMADIPSNSQILDVLDSWKGKSD